MKCWTITKYFGSFWVWGRDTEPWNRRKWWLIGKFCPICLWMTENSTFLHTFWTLPAKWIIMLWWQVFVKPLLHVQFLDLNQFSDQPHWLKGRLGTHEEDCKTTGCVYSNGFSQSCSKRPLASYLGSHITRKMQISRPQPREETKTSISSWR